MMPSRRKEASMTARSHRVPMLVAAILLALTSAAGAQPRVEEKANIAVTGDIEAIDVAARKLTIQSTNDDGVVYGVEDAATIMMGSQKLELGDLKVGWNVAVNGHELRGNRTLTYIKVVKAPTD
jgi:Cu/Ag efflux protein CusF